MKTKEFTLTKKQYDLLIKEMNEFDVAERYAIDIIGESGEITETGMIAYQYKSLSDWLFYSDSIREFVIHCVDFFNGNELLEDSTQYSNLKDFIVEVEV